MKVRVKFAKYGCMKFIGHLDVMRFFQKALRRAGIDVAYSTGYSPHQIMSFASPLGLGMHSNGEYMDIEVNTPAEVNTPTEVNTSAEVNASAATAPKPRMSSAEMRRRLNEVSVPGIEVLSVKALPENAGNAMASVAAARYTVYFKDPSLNFHFLDSCMETFLAQPAIAVTKETKKGTSRMDLRPGIYECRVTADGNLEFLVDASSSGNIKPSLLINALWKFAGPQRLPYFEGQPYAREEELPLTALQQVREETYTNTGTPESPVFVPLDEVGEDF